ncbi:hypothetical protein BD289DRAFT_114164 [Coniella lustricola]|uniref:Protein prenyltransferase n=1 Tax=Coniella lustricola TaxID=2025994 RepID=A0A2T2ZX52_9PEZI|nr:hypothetical protein BD289DRAFT_114164 [Coniella lustricola]
MSRALDKATLQALSRNDPETAYKAISAAVTQYQVEKPADELLLEIEVLPKSHVLEPGTFLLQDGNALGISKLGLVQAFFWARQRFQDYSGISAAPVLPDELLAITSVMLLMDPEHLTAANARKRMIQAGHTSSQTHQRIALISQDLFFIDSLLTSRLHRHTKSPTLWSHRRWLVQSARSCGSFPDVTRDVQRIVMVAGQRHPRNYYAWCHARWLLGSMLFTKQQPEKQQEEKNTVDERSPLSELTAATKAWCFRNHTDISGWSFLASLLSRLGAAERHAVYKDVGELCGSLQWTNESTWVFLRTLAASGIVEDADVGLFRNVLASLLRDCQSEAANHASGKRILQQAQAWFEAYQKSERPVVVI